MLCECTQILALINVPPGCLPTSLILSPQHNFPPTPTKSVSGITQDSHKQQPNEVLRHICAATSRYYSGNLPAPTIANIFLSLREQEEILPKFIFNLYLYRRFINDEFEIWKHGTDSAVELWNYKAFKKDVNSGGLYWTVIDIHMNVDVMDLTVNSIGSMAIINFYEKPLALHWYIPPHACHPPSCFGSQWQGKFSAYTASAPSRKVWPTD